MWVYRWRKTMQWAKVNKTTPNIELKCCRFLSWVRLCQQLGPNHSRLGLFHFCLPSSTPEISPQDWTPDQLFRIPLIASIYQNTAKNNSFCVQNRDSPKGEKLKTWKSDSANYMVIRLQLFRISALQRPSRTSLGCSAGQHTYANGFDFQGRIFCWHTWRL